MVPTGTVSVAGANAKLLTLTAFGPVGAGAVFDAGACGAVPDAGDAPPVIPGVTLACGPKLIDGCESAAGPELAQPDTNSTAVAVTATAAGAVRRR